LSDSGVNKIEVDELKALSSDEILKDLINSIPEQPRYMDVIESYYDMFGEQDLSSSSDKYENVLASITKLWVNSEKNPSLFKDTKDFEPILLSKQQPYRDHFVHSFNVFLLGYYLVNKLSYMFPEKRYFGREGHDYNLTWMLTATFHDVAYPVQETESWLNLLFDKFFGVNPNFSVNISQILPAIYVDFMRMLSYYQQDPKQSVLNDNAFQFMDWSFYDELGSGLFRKDHGVLSALMLCHRMAIREGFLVEKTTGKGRWDFLYNHLPAGHAIGVHTASTSVSFAKHPFAFLLVLCDEIQDWGRPSNKDNDDVIELRDISIDGSEIPTIGFEILASENRRVRLANVLEKRLAKDNSINIEILPPESLE
jgi:hypothetical protein